MQLKLKIPYYSNIHYVRVSFSTSSRHSGSIVSAVLSPKNGKRGDSGFRIRVVNTVAGDWSDTVSFLGTSGGDLRENDAVRSSRWLCLGLCIVLLKTPSRILLYPSISLPISSKVSRDSGPRPHDRHCIAGRLHPSHSLPAPGLGRAFSLHNGQRLVSCLEDPDPSSHWSMHLASWSVLYL